MTFKIGRKAGNGRFVSVEYAKKHAKTAIVETVKHSKQSKKK